MKKIIIKLSLLLVFFVSISYFVIVSFGEVYTTEFDVSSGDEYTFNVENETGKVEIINKKIDNGKLIVKMKAVKPGKFNLDVNFGDYSLYKVFYIHKNMVITDNNYFGKSTYSEVIPICIILYLLYVLYLLIKVFIVSTRQNLYQYKNIVNLGIIIFISFFIVVNFMSIFNYQGLYSSINNIIGSVNFISHIMFPLILITFILVTISNIYLIIKEGKSIRNVLGLFMGLFLCTLILLPDIVYSILLNNTSINIFNLNSAGPYIYNFIEFTIYLLVVYFVCLFISILILLIVSVKKKVSYNKDFIIILGCMIKKDGSLTPLLKGRVDRALEFRNEQLKNTGMDLIFVASGGKGSDECISEAQAMKNYLLEKGISEDSILVEDKSTNTYENIKYSMKLIKYSNFKVAFSTTSYHVLRSGLIASEQGYSLEGIGSKTKMYFWINAFIREFIGTLYSGRKKHIIMFICILLFISFIIAIIYITNNI